MKNTMVPQLGVLNESHLNDLSLASQYAVHFLLRHYYSAEPLKYSHFPNYCYYAMSVFLIDSDYFQFKESVSSFSFTAINSAVVACFHLN